MRLKSAILRNYRIHRELSVEFDPRLTLIGGPNEGGKSTLVEGVHRALFLRAKTGGEAQKAMVSRVHGGHPEVEVCFEAGKREYRLVKRFSGQSGTATLTELGGQSWSGDEAETQLAELLGVEAMAGRRGAGERVKEQWAHLWIWQGAAGSDPTEHATAQCQPLLARLQGEGGAAAMQSECDARVAQEFSRQREVIFSRQGPRSGTELALAEAREQKAREKHQEAAEKLARLELSIDNYQAAEKAITDAQTALQELRPLLEKNEANRLTAASLRSREQVELGAANHAREKHEALIEADRRIRELESEIARLRGELAPEEVEIRRLEEEEAKCWERERVAATEWQDSQERVRAARLRAELATAHTQRIERGLTRDQIETRLGKVKGWRSQAEELRSELAKLPLVDGRKLKALQRAEIDLATEQAALKAMAAEIELLGGGAAVRVNGQSIRPGEAQTLIEEAMVEIAPDVRLRIRPGGGANLGEKRKRVQEDEAALQADLDRLGIKSVTEAVEAVARRQQLENEIKTIEARLETLGADRIEAEFESAKGAHEAAIAEVERKAAMVTDAAIPGGLEDAQELARRFGEELRKVEQDEVNARAMREAAAKAREQASAKRTEHQRALDLRRRGLADGEARLRLLVESHGDEAVRRVKLQELKDAREAAEAVLEKTRRELAQLQPELLESDRVRLLRSIERHTDTRNEAAKKQAVARSELNRDGAADPHETFAMAKADLEFATEQRAAAQRKAEAIKLLDDLFTAEQRELADQFTAPLVRRISGYLECLFGAGARAEVDLEDNEFKRLRLVRPGWVAGALEFSSLSGGTCEQVAAAVRLAMAEVLAAGHDGCLPVVFDDAFAYSDPERVRTLQRMLDRAAANGLQIIVVTCNPADYRTLGAKQVEIRRPMADVV